MLRLMLLVSPTRAEPQEGTSINQLGGVQRSQTNFKHRRMERPLNAEPRQRDGACGGFASAPPYLLQVSLVGFVGDDVLADGPGSSGPAQTHAAVGHISDLQVSSWRHGH